MEVFMFRRFLFFGIVVLFVGTGLGHELELINAFHFEDSVESIEILNFRDSIVMVVQDENNVSVIFPESGRQHIIDDPEGILDSLTFFASDEYIIAYDESSRITVYPTFGIDLGVSGYNFMFWSDYYQSCIGINYAEHIFDSRLDPYSCSEDLEIYTYSTIEIDNITTGRMISRFYDVPIPVITPQVFLCENTLFFSSRYEGVWNEYEDRWDYNDYGILQFDDSLKNIINNEVLCAEGEFSSNGSGIYVNNICNGFLGRSLTDKDSDGFIDIPSYMNLPFDGCIMCYVANNYPEEPNVCFNNLTVSLLDTPDFLLYGRFFPNEDSLSRYALLCGENYYRGDSLQHHFTFDSWLPEYANIKGFADFNGDGFDELFGWWNDTLRIYKCFEGDGISEEITKPKTLDVTCYPNPFNSTFNIDLTNVDKVSKIRIFDISGNEVVTIDNAVPSTVKTISTSHLNSGVYLIDVQTRDGVYGEKVVLIK